MATYLLSGQVSTESPCLESADGRYSAKILPTTMMPGPALINLMVYDGMNMIWQANGFGSSVLRDCS